MALKSPLKVFGWRKVAIGAWRSIGDPSVYGVLELPVAPVLAYIEKRRHKSGIKITMTHFIGKMIAEAFKRHPEINCLLRFGKLYPRQTIDVFFLVAPDAIGKDLTGTVIREADAKSIEDFARELNHKAGEIKSDRDVDFSKMKAILSWIPDFLLGCALWAVEAILYRLNLHLPLLGLPRNAFGSVMVTSIGSLGLDFAFAPLVPFSRVPMMLAPGKVLKRLKLVDGQVVEEPYLRLCVTFDHRLIDGVHASLMAKTIHLIFAQPETELG